MAAHFDTTDGRPIAREPEDGESSPPAVMLQVPALLEYRDLVCRAVSSVCKHAFSSADAPTDGVGTGRFTNELMSAVGEAFNNVVMHAYDGGGPGAIAMKLVWESDHIAVTMSDQGTSFDFESVPDIDLETPHESGMGIHIIRSFVDDVTYRPGSPNVLTMIKTIR